MENAMHHVSRLRWTLVATFAFALPTVSAAAPVVFSATGANPAAVQVQVDNFRSALGSLNPNVAGSFESGRREINWDGVPDNLSAPNNLPANFFNDNSPRGVVFSTPGTGFQVSANASNPTNTPIEFGNIQPTYPSIFSTFSPQRLFTALGSTITDVNFFVPGSSTAALVSGFGVVFTSVNLANVTSLQFFSANNSSLGTFFAPASPTNPSLSFLGVQFTEGSVVSRVRITSGNQVLAPGNTLLDLVVMDDFIYGEPTAIPEPTSLILFGSGTFGLLGVVRRRRGRTP